MSRALIRNSVSDWMWNNDLSPADIVMATGASQSSVSLTIKGERNDKRVLNFLRSKGCCDLIIQNRKRTIVRR